MRNLKKFLALFMAMMMALSLMVTVNAKNVVFSDSESVTEDFQEDIIILNGMGVVQGYEDGSFGPTKNVTRGQMAAFIYRIATGDASDKYVHNYVGYNTFKDVKDSDWFAGYIGYCSNAGYIVGYGDGTFKPFNNVTGYQALAMILRAVGYNEPGHNFTGTGWETYVSSTATQRGMLVNVNKTNYAHSLKQAANRELVAELTFQGVIMTRVQYTAAYGYQTYDHIFNGDHYNVYRPLGWVNYGLEEQPYGILLGNQQTGESKSVMGYDGDSGDYNTLNEFLETTYAWTGKDNIRFDMETGIDLVGHNLDVWYNCNNNHVYAFFDRATKVDVVTADTIDLTNSDADDNADTVDLGSAASAAGFSLNGDKSAIFNNSFGKFGSGKNFSDAADVVDGTKNDADVIGNGLADTYPKPIESPVKLYKLIANGELSGNPSRLDAVISLNIESSQITESNDVNRVPTVSVPVNALNPGASKIYATGTPGASGVANVTNILGRDSAYAQVDTEFIDFTQNDGAPGTIGTVGANVKVVNGVATGVVAKAALVGNSAKALGDYEMGIHITGTSPRNVSPAEKEAINGTGAETAYYLLNKVEATVEGKVVAYNNQLGTVTLDNGTVLNRSKYYNTVVIKAKGTSTEAPQSAVPQAWLRDANAVDDPIIERWREGYANVAYKFYTDHDGNYIGAERTFGSTFLYGTYQDYTQETNSSTFNYYLTGIDMNGETQTVQLKSFWKADAIPANSTTLTTITGTNDLNVPFRDASNAGAGATNGIGRGRYVGYAISGTTGDPIVTDQNINRNEYLSNMARLGIKNAKWLPTGAANLDFDSRIVINNTSITVGAQVTKLGGGKYFTEGTKFILVSGFGTDSVKADVYNGITELLGSATTVSLNMPGTYGLGFDWTGLTAPTHNEMTYYTESAYTYAQNAETDTKIDTIILPRAAVTWTGGSGLYYIGDPTPSLTNSWGIDAWKYTLYIDGVAEEVWLTNPTMTNDVFLNLRQTTATANDGQPIFTAGSYDMDGNFTPGAWLDNGTTLAPAPGTDCYSTSGTNNLRPQLGYMQRVIYRAVTQDAQTANFYNAASDPVTLTMPAGTAGILERVADAKVVNLNASNSPKVSASSNGYIWPGITDMATLNAAGSIDPVTGRELRVSALVDPSNPLVVTCIYVCWDQNPPTT